MSLGMNGASTLTNLQNSQDLSPNYAPTIYGIINSIGSITGIINPLIVGYITADHVSTNILNMSCDCSIFSKAP